ncbi:MAG: hypothetical protein K0S65_5409, partial [Labilithrix sp.]|nr:hypothetical protein [Labilithrix sp.]
SAGDGVVWAVGWNDQLITDAEGTILRWDGHAWAVHFKAEKRLNAVWGSSPTDLWVGGDDGLYHGTGPSSAEITWTKVRSEPIASIWGTSANDVWAVGSTKTWQTLFDGKVLHYQGPVSDGGDGWEIDAISSRPAAYRKVWGTSDSDVWIGGSEFSTCGMDICNGTRAITLRRRPAAGGGFEWSDAAMPGFRGIEPATGIHPGSEFSGGGFVGQDRVWVMGSQAPKTNNVAPVYDVLFMGTPKSDGSGDYAWSDGTFGTCTRNGTVVGCKGLWFSRAVWGKDPNDVFLASDSGQLRHWDGSSFSFVKTTIEKVPITASLFAMWGSSSTDLWIVGDEIALHKTSLNPTRK